MAEIKEAKSNKKWIWLAVLICLIVVAGGIYYYQNSLKPFDPVAQKGGSEVATPGAANKLSDNDNDTSKKMSETDNIQVGSASKIKSDLTAKDIDRITMKGSNKLIATLNFEFAAATTPTEAIENLVKDVSAKLDGKTKIVIEGHTDSIGSVDFNQDLSNRRAMFVADKMKGFKKNKSIKIGVVGRGKTKLIADNSTEDGRAKSRRVEIYLE